MSAATALVHVDGETTHVGFWDVITSVSREDFKVELRLDGQIPPGDDKLVLTFPFIKPNPIYVGKEHIPLRRVLTDHETAVAKQPSVDFTIGPQATSQERLAAVKAKDSAKPKSMQTPAIDKDMQKLAKHILG